MSQRDHLQPQLVRIRRAGPWSGTVIKASDANDGERSGHDRFVGDIVVLPGPDAATIVQMAIGEYEDEAQIREEKEREDAARLQAQIDEVVRRGQSQTPTPEAPVPEAPEVEDE